VVAFTASQIAGIAGRRYPAVLARPLYPEGIPIVDEAEIEELCRAQNVDEVVFAYGDVAHNLCDNEPLPLLMSIKVICCRFPETARQHDL
jgi:predicted GTPase